MGPIASRKVPINCDEYKDVTDSILMYNEI